MEKRPNLITLAFIILCAVIITLWLRGVERAVAKQNSVRVDTVHVDSYPVMRLVLVPDTIKIFVGQDLIREYVPIRDYPTFTEFSQVNN